VKKSGKTPLAGSTGGAMKLPDPTSITFVARMQHFKLI
jgi:hypothetical protein